MTVDAYRNFRTDPMRKEMTAVVGIQLPSRSPGFGHRPARSAGSIHCGREIIRRTALLRCHYVILHKWEPRTALDPFREMSL